MVEQVLDVLVILTGFQTGLVVDDNFNLCGVTAVLLALGVVNIDCIEDALWDLKGILLASLDQLVWISIH